MEEPALAPGCRSRCARLGARRRPPRPLGGRARAGRPPAARPDACARPGAPRRRAGRCRRVGLDRGHTRVRHRRRRLARLRAPVDVPLEQRAEDGRSLVFDTQPLDETVEILGIPRARLVVSADQPQALLAVRLCDVAPDGYVDARHARRPQPDAPRERRVPHAARPRRGRGRDRRAQRDRPLLPAGHRIRLAVSPTYWPWAWPSPATAELTFALPDCSLELPVRPRPASEPAVVFAEPEWAPSIEVVSADVTPSRRTITRDVGPGGSRSRPTSRIRRAVVPQRPHLPRGHARRGHNRARRPPLGRVRCERTIRMRQGDWSIRVEAWARCPRPRCLHVTTASTRTRARRASPRSCGRARSRATRLTGEDGADEDEEPEHSRRAC